MKRHLIALMGLAALAGAAPVFAEDAPAASDSRFAAGLRSVKIAVNDFEQSTKFYEAIGMEPGPKRDQVWEMVWDSDTRNSGVLMVSPEYASRAQMERGGTYLMVTTPDMGAVVERLRQIGYPEIGEPKAMGGNMVTVLMLKDPDGNRIEMLGPLSPE